MASPVLPLSAVIVCSRGFHACSNAITASETRRASRVGTNFILSTPVALQLSVTIAPWCPLPMIVSTFKSPRRIFCSTTLSRYLPYGISSLYDPLSDLASGNVSPFCASACIGFHPCSCLSRHADRCALLTPKLASNFLPARGCNLLVATLLRSPALLDQTCDAFLSSGGVAVPFCSPTQHGNCPSSVFIAMDLSVDR